MSVEVKTASVHAACTFSLIHSTMIEHFVKLAPPKQILYPHITKVIFWALSLFGSEGTRSYIFHSYMTEIHQQVWRRTCWLEAPEETERGEDRVILLLLILLLQFLKFPYGACSWPCSNACLCVLFCSTYFLIWYLFISSPKSKKWWPDVIIALIKLTDAFNQISHLHSCSRSTDVQKKRIDPQNRPRWMTSFTCIIRQI